MQVMWVLSAFSFVFNCMAGTWVLSLFCNDCYACGFQVGSQRDARRKEKRREEKMREEQSTAEQRREGKRREGRELRRGEQLREEDRRGEE